jgi:hypothetical protein
MMIKRHDTIKTYGEVKVQLCAFLTLVTDGGKWSASHPSCFTHREEVPRAQWIEDWMGSRAGLNVVEKRRIS